MDRSMMALFLLFYASLISHYSFITRLVRSFVFFACTMLALPVSEPVGELVLNYVDASYTWAEHLTSFIVVALTALVVAFLRRFSTEKLIFVPTFPAIVVGVVSALSTFLTLVCTESGAARSYSVIQAVCFWVIILLTYYMFYAVSKEYEQNMEFMAVQHKEELDGEMLQFSRESYEEMHQIRHEVKNHLAYIRVLSECGEYDKLKEYLNVVSGETEELFHFVECGNDVINAVMNHAIKQARANGVEIDFQIVVPPELPYRETDLCSLLSNLMDNAIEASVRAGVEQPVISVSIRPQQDYLFLRVSNPVGEEAVGWMSLQTTKADKRLHGYGTKIIRRVAEQYEGSAKFGVQDRMFVVDVMLSLEEDQDGETAFSDL